MSLKRPAKEQPESFEFNSSSLETANKIITKYPKGKQQSAVMALLYIAQRQNNNWIPLAAMKYIAKILDMPYIKVYEVATFYSMYNLSPVGKYFVQVCTTTPCMIRGANKLVEACKEKISENESELSPDKSCSWMEVECLGACVNAPMMQINDEYYEDLNKEKTLEILDKILKGDTPKAGSYRGRVNNEPENNKNSITPFLDFSIFGVFVFITIPLAAGIAQEAIGFGDFSISTKHILQFPAIDNFS